MAIQRQPEPTQTHPEQHLPERKDIEPPLAATKDSTGEGGPGESQFLAGYQATVGEGASDMDWQEKYIEKLDRDVSEMKASLRQAEEHIERLVGDLRQDIKDQMGGLRREMDTLRHEVKSETDSLRREMDTLRHEVKSEVGSLCREMDGIHRDLADIRSDMRSLQNEIRGTNKWIPGFVITAIAGITAIAVSVIAFITSAISRL